MFNDRSEQMEGYSPLQNTTLIIQLIETFKARSRKLHQYYVLMNTAVVKYTKT